MKGITIKHTNNHIAQRVQDFLKNGTAFIFHDEGENFGPMFIPDKLACIHFGEVLIHSGIPEFIYSVSFQMGIYDCVSELRPKQIEDVNQKLLPYAATVEGQIL